MRKVPMMMWTRGQRRALAASAMLGLSGCGGASTDGRWEDDAQLPLVPGEGDPAADQERYCEATALTPSDAQGFQYADPPSFWLGSQAPRTLRVDGFGYLVLGEAAGDPPARRYARELTVVIGPSGALEDDAGRPLLGYLPGGDTVGGDCLAPVRAALESPPHATTQLVYRMNLDPRTPVVDFNLFDPDGTSNASTSLSVWDSAGGIHTLDTYFNNRGGGLYVLSFVVDGGDLEGETPGQHHLVGTGTLQFTTDGALDNAAVPVLDISFVGATPNQEIAIDFGPSIAFGDAGLSGTTSFATDTAVFSLAQDGLPPGTGVDAVVDGWGVLHGLFDSGATAPLGTLALARFPREAELLTDADGLQRETLESGAPLLGRPLDPGRGSLRTE
jgi:flagellar hook protein FlgE